MPAKARGLLAAYAITNAMLYSALLPLWEGFDEPFHFGYVQQIANGWGFPDASSARLSEEVARSMVLAPASSIVQRNLPQVTTYTDFFAWPAQKRAEARQQLVGIQTELSSQPSPLLNYEAQQAPLSYLVLALPERALAGLPIPSRVLALRIVAALSGALLLFFGAEVLFTLLDLDGNYRPAAMFCLLSCQMIWATVAHVANDWLALPLSVWLLVTVIRYSRHPSAGGAGWMSGILAAGLLTKAYFIAFVPLVLAMCAVRRRWRELSLTAAILVAAGGTWYGRNLARYGEVTGMQEVRAGVGARAVLEAVPTMRWPAVIYSSAHEALWTGNNTFLSFSAKTLNLLMGVWAAALALWFATRRTQPERITMFYCVWFGAALAYESAVNYVATHGAAGGPGAWHSQVLMAPLLGLAFLGMQRRPRFGRILAGVLAGIFGYVLIATYVVKLIPVYGGYEGRTAFRAAIQLYADNWKMLATNLGLVSLAPAAAIFTLTGMIVILTMFLLFILIRALVGRDARARVLTATRSAC